MIEKITEQIITDAWINEGLSERALILDQMSNPKKRRLCELEHSELHDSILNVVKSENNLIYNQSGRSMFVHQAGAFILT